MPKDTDQPIFDDDNRIWLSFPDFWKLPRSKYIAEVMCQEFWKIIDPSKSGQSGMSSNGAYTELNLDSDRILSRFRIWNIPNKFTHDLVVSIAGVEGNCQEEETFWRKVLTKSIARVHSDPEAYSWECVIGPLPDLYSGGYKLISSISMGELKINAATNPTWECRPSLSHGLVTGAGGSIHETWPVWVHGTAYTYYEFETASIALKDANLAALILTLALNQAWAPRYQPMTEPDHQLKIPSYADNAQQLQNDEWPPDNYESRAIEIDLADWCKQVWERLQKLEANKIRKAMFMFREGVILATDHPSLARVAFVAAVEALPRPKSERCTACNNPIGLTDAFKQMVRVEDSPYASERLEANYSARSRTVHEGRVSEAELASHLSVFLRDPRDFEFESPVGMTGPGTLRGRTRELILERLGVYDPIPEV